MRVIHVVLVVGCVACSAATSTSFGFGDDGSGVGGVAIDASANGGFGDCPASLPAPGTSCSATNICEYGFAATESCNARAQCSEGRWQMLVAQSDCVDQCPKSFDDIVEGAACDAVGSVCSFYEATCGCVDPSAASDGGGGGGGDAGSDASSDAGDGDASVAATGRWVCTHPAPGCPSRRPHQGEACVTSMTCDYGTCLFDRDLTFACNSGWETTFTSCP